MSQPCATSKCERTSRAPCDCCKQNLCLEHLYEHNSLLVAQLNPLTDEINAIGDRFNRLNIHETAHDCREKLEEWRLDCHQKIDCFFEQKCQELDRLIAAKIDEEREKILHIKTKLVKLTREQEATRQDIDTLTSSIRNLGKAMNKIEQERFQVNIRPLSVDDTIIQFKEIYVHEFDPSTLSSVYKTIVYPKGSYRALATNNQSLLIHQVPNLCLLDTELTVVKQVLWLYEPIRDIFFIIISWISLTNTILEDDILYDIKWQPALATPIELENNFIFTSKRKEKYSCVLPTPQTTVTTTAETVLFSEIEPFLENLHSKKPCIYRLEPYWIYELCHGIHIRQYHEAVVAGKKTILHEYFLGYYHLKDQDIITNNDNQQILKVHYKTINHQQVPMLSIRYTDGTKCDINSDNPRETVVYYLCDDKGNEGIINFQEISSCYYEMTVSSSKLCNIPTFSPAEFNRHTINCYPQENAPQKPRNLKKLETERYLQSKNGGGGQFTLTGADGTTFIISYEYINEDDLKDLTNNLNTDLTNKIPPSENEQQQQQPDKNDREFLEGFLSGRDCLTGGLGWWKYEFCYGKHVMQFHEEGQQRTTVLLGKWDREKHIEWVKANPRKRSSGNVKERQYLLLYYTNGDQCETTKTPRMVEVKLRCVKRSDKSRTPAMYLVEPEACSYVLGIETPIFCDLSDYIDENGIPDQEKLIKRLDEQ